jgi:hypothetical protein
MIFISGCGGGDFCGKYKNTIWHQEQDIERLHGEIDYYQSKDNQYCSCEYQYQASE